MLNDFAGQNAALLYKSKEPWMCTVHAHFYSILWLESDTVHSLNFVKNLEKMFPDMQPKQLHSVKFLRSIWSQDFLNV